MIRKGFNLGSLGLVGIGLRGHFTILNEFAILEEFCIAGEIFHKVTSKQLN